MASPVKAFIDPSGALFDRNTVSFLSKAGPPLTPTFTLIAPVQVEEVTSRFSIAPTSFQLPLITVGLPIKSNFGYLMTVTTFSSIYQERSASAARPTEGQLYPLGI
ncbi:MAG: hypothetical protein JHC33_00600 [Ignisphaera sp.]|nr:hypothetical protein [Ignisphaera sp.]